MRIESLELKNYRQYKNMVITFPKVGNFDIHIVIGDNGVGKTNILNAITWCLYGDEPHLGNEKKDEGLFRLNTSYYDEIKNDEDKCECGNHELISVKLTCFDEEAGGRVVFYRTVDYDIKLNSTTYEYFEYEPQFNATVTWNNGNSEVFENTQGRLDADDIVDIYFPKRIREYFFFDGEQLDSYFTANVVAKDGNRIRNSVHSISKIDVISRIKSRLDTLIREKNSELGKVNPKIKDINDKILSLNKRYDEVQQDISEFTNEITESEKKVKEDTDALKGRENIKEYEQQFQSLSNDQIQIESERKVAIENLYEFIVNKKIAFALYPAAKNALNIINEKHKNHSLPPQVSRKLLEECISLHKCSICGQHVDDTVEARINDLLSKLDVSTEASNILSSMKGELEHLINEVENYDNESSRVTSTLQSINKRLKNCKDALENVDNHIHSLGNAEEARFLYDERAQHQDLIKENTKQLGAYEKESEELKSAIEENQTQLQVELNKKKDKDQLTIEVEFLTKAYKTIIDIESESMREVKIKLEKSAFKYYEQLMWKKDVYTSIELDENYKLNLLHRGGYKSVGTCSAAERILLALAFTLALHDVSGFNAMLFIDTPVARVSGENRKNFADVLKEVSKNKQLIMTLTPDEYSQDVQSIFKNCVSSKAHLIMDTSKEITNFK
jgi:DNA sulfur modification protein DndD